MHMHMLMMVIPMGDDDDEAVEGAGGEQHPVETMTSVAPSAGGASRPAGQAGPAGSVWPAAPAGPCLCPRPVAPPNGRRALDLSTFSSSC